MGGWLVDAFAQANPDAPHKVLQLITGTGATGAALCTSGVNKLAFTGSARTGRKVMSACAESLTPVLMELGGKDAFIVAEDADLEQAARDAVWGALQNAGQACISVERVYVVDSVYDEFVKLVAQKAEQVHAGSDKNAGIGPITMPSQVNIIKAHIEDALRRGAHAVVGGGDSVRGRLVEPVGLTDVPADSPALGDEAFGPTLPTVR